MLLPTRVSLYTRVATRESLYSLQMDKMSHVTQTLSFDSILRAETQHVKTMVKVQVQGDKVMSKLSLFRNIQTGGEVGELVRYWAKSLDNEEDISTYDSDEDTSVENDEENAQED